jgi:hypothetical protein
MFFASPASTFPAKELGDDPFLVVAQSLRLPDHHARGERRVDRFGRHLPEGFGAGSAVGSRGIFVGAGLHVLMAARTVAIEQRLSRHAGRRADHRRLWLFHLLRDRQECCR